MSRATNVKRQPTWARKRKVWGEKAGGSGWGGARKGAGRPKIEGSISHLSRPALASRYPVHVTLKVDSSLPSLRTRLAFPALVQAFVDGRAGTVAMGGFRLVHFSVQHGQIHLVVEGKDREHLSRGMQGLQVRMAKALNRTWGRKGKVFSERYTARILRTPLEVKNVLEYMLWNAYKQGAAGRDRSRAKANVHDPCASGAWLRGWKRGTEPPVPAGPTPVMEPGTWLMRVGWKRHGLFPVKT